MKKTIGEIYLDAIQKAILKASGGQEGLVDVTAVTLACVGLAASTAAMLPKKDRINLTKHVVKTFPIIVEDARQDAEECGFHPEFVRLDS